MAGIRLSILSLSVLLLLPVAAPLANDRNAMKEDNSHIRRWNGFADKLLQIHRQLIAEQAHTVKTSTGGYPGMAQFYQEEAYYNKQTGKLISRVQWERENRQRMHTIEVYLYDKQGRVSRDYSAAYLPSYRNAPTQTLISLHAYNGKTHAFRSFDATGDHILDRCEGTYQNEPVNFLLDEDELYEELDGLRLSADYKHCMKGLPERADKYASNPH